MRYFEEYKCGCVSKIVRTKKDLVGYCGKHGDDMRNVYPVFTRKEQLDGTALHSMRSDTEATLSTGRKLPGVLRDRRKN